VLQNVSDRRLAGFLKVLGRQCDYRRRFIQWVLANPGSRDDDFAERSAAVASLLRQAWRSCQGGGKSDCSSDRKPDGTGKWCARFHSSIPHVQKNDNRNAIG
jgi:hypothetical protein